MNTLIKNAVLLLPDGKTRQGDLAVEGNRIRAVGKVPEDFSWDKMVDGSGKLAAPGFVNGHTHAAMTLLRSYADDMALMDWLQDKIWPVEDRMTEDDLYWGTMLAAVEMIRTGTTAFADMYGPYVDGVARAVIDSGLRGILARGIVAVAPGAEEKLEDSVRLYRTYHGAEDGRITVMLSPHAIYTCPPEFISKLADKAKMLGADVHIHMSETRGEVEDCLKNYGKRPFAHVESTGLFENGTLAAHCVYLDDEDLEIIKKHDIRVVHNPGSNLKLASGIAPVQRLLKEGVCVGLGTDGASSNNNLDMLEEVRLAALLSKVETMDPQAVPAFQAIRMGTELGARAAGLKDVGRIEEGYKADIVLYSMDGPEWHPCHNPVSLLAYSANGGAVDTVLVDGRVLMEKKKLLTIDEEKVYFEVERCLKHLTDD